MAWNRPSDTYDTKGVCSHAQAWRGSRFWLITLLVAIASAIAVSGWFYMTPQGQIQTKDASHVRETNMIKEVTPIQINNSVVADEPEEEAKNDILQIGSKTYNLAKLRRDNPQLYEQVTGEHARVEAQLEKIRRSPVKGIAEQLLALSTPGEKGEAIPPLPISEDDVSELEQEADKMLSELPKVEEYDTEVSLEIKNNLIELKEEFLAAREQGMSFYDFIRKRQERAHDDAAHLQDAVKLNEEIYTDETVSDKDYEATRKKIDKLLKLEGYKGLPPLTEEQVQSAEEHAEQQAEEVK